MSSEAGFDGIIADTITKVQGRLALLVRFELYPGVSAAGHMRDATAVNTKPRCELYQSNIARVRNARTVLRDSSE